MANLTFPKSALEPRPQLPAGMIQVMFTGFKQKLSKKKEGKEQSVNLNPVLTIVNDSRTGPDGKILNGQKLFESLNLSFLPRVQDFFHCFGLELIEDGDNVDLPGSFANGTSDPNPEKWGLYSGAAINEIGDLELIEVPSRKAGAKPTDKQTDIKRYICRVPGCTVNHMENLSQG